MIQKKLKTLARSLAYFTLILMVFPAYIVAQRAPSTWDLLLGKKPKDYNKTPDPAEFQNPVNGEYKANPSFFETRSNDDKCKAIDLWLSSIRYEVSRSPSYARSSYNYGRDNVLDMDRVDAKDILKYSTAHFQNIFSREVANLNEKDSKEISKFLDKCSYQRWVDARLVPVFDASPSKFNDWAASFREMQDSVNKERVEEQKRLYREKYQEEARRNGYGAAEPLKGTEAYQLYAAFLNDGNTDWCSQADGQAVTALVHNVDENTAIQNNEAYWRTFDSDILPAIRSSCPEARKVYVLNYVRNYFIDYSRNQIRTQADRPSSSDVLNVAVYFADQSGATQRGWINGDSMSNIFASSGSSRRGQGSAAFRQSDSPVSSANLVTVASVRKFLATRQAKIDEDARIRNEKAAEAERARQAELARKAEARRSLLASGGFSSKGLKNEEIFTNIFLGDFEALPFQRDDISFSTLFGAYLKSFAESCSSALPSNRVQMTRQECAVEKETRNGWGTLISTTCVEWRTVPTGLYADPQLYAARNSVERAQAAKILNPKSGGGIFGGILEALQDFSTGKTLNEMNKAIDVSNDVPSLLSLNACSGPGLKRFQENMRRYALNESPLLTPLTSPRAETAPAKTESEKPQTIVQKSTPAQRKTGTARKRPKN